MTRRRVPPQLWGLLVLFAVEVAAFSAAGTNFFSAANAFGVLRLNVELGVVALALTPVIVTGGIDLSVGSMMGLAAVCFGALTKTFGLPWPVAAAAAVGVGAVGGAVNGWFVARLKVPPLIVTLATFSLFRGVAEGVTGGATTYTAFPASFLWLGQGHVGPVPAQAGVLVVAAVGFYLLLHRSTVGRSLSAIGFSPEGARHAALPVGRRLVTAYVLSGACAALAAVIYVARVGQAKSDAGTGYELAAITAVVLGGTSIFGGRGSVPGTLLGLAALAVLDNGLRLADRPAELAGILQGVLLLVAIGADRLRAAPRQTAPVTEEFEMRNSQLAVLCGTILVAALVIVGGNVALVLSLRGVAAAPAATPSSGGHRPVIGMMPKNKGEAYFISCRKGAEAAAKELDVDLLWDGPTASDPAKQNEVVDTWVTRGVDAIAVSVNNADSLSTALRAARAKGIKVVTWDSDAQPDARDWFVNQATPQGIGTTLMDDAAAALGGKGEFAIVTDTLASPNQNEWMTWIEKRRAERYPDVRRVTVQPCDGNQAKAFAETQTILNANPGVRVVMAICAPAVPGAAEAVKQLGRTDVRVVGLGLPNENKPYVHGGITTAVVLWNTTDLGYLAVEAADAAVRGTIRPGAVTLHAGRLGDVKVVGDDVMLGVPTTFDKGNIDGFDF